jgi:hypothetical protein
LNDETIVTVKFSVTEHPTKGWMVWYAIDNDPPISLHGRWLSREAAAKSCACDGAWIVQKAMSTYKSVMGWSSITL